MTATEEIHRLAETCDALRQQLAASVAERERLRDALEDALEWAEWLERQECYAPIGKAWWPDKARVVLGETAAREGEPSSE